MLHCLVSFKGHFKCSSNFLETGEGPFLFHYHNSPCTKYMKKCFFLVWCVWPVQARHHAPIVLELGSNGSKSIPKARSLSRRVAAVMTTYPCPWFLELDVQFMGCNVHVSTYFWPRSVDRCWKQACIKEREET